jgi:hypothetical protein
MMLSAAFEPRIGLQGKAGVVDILQAFLDPTNSQRLPTYEEAAAKLEVSLGGVKTLIQARLEALGTSPVTEAVPRDSARRSRPNRGRSGRRW